MALRCTAKALQLARIPRHELPTPEPDGDDWYLNVVWVDRRKCLLATHADTAFSAVMLDVKVAHTADLGGLVRGAIRRTLADERLDPGALGDLDQTTAIVAPTASRRVLGVMNEIAEHVWIWVLREGGARRADPLMVARQLQVLRHRYPDGWDQPIRLARRRSPTPAGTGDGIVLRVEMLQLPEPVWRRLEVPAAATLNDLDEALMAAFGWARAHMSGFFTDAPWRGRCFAHRSYLDDLEEAEPTDTVTVGDLLGSPKSELYWLYDFGDRWAHRLTSETTRPLADGRTRCTAGGNATPPEDCGGPESYWEMVAVLADPSHPDHPALLEWLEEPLDPHAFDLHAVNEDLARLNL